MTFIPLLWLIPLLPLAGFLLNGLLGRRFLPDRAVAVIGCGTILLAFLLGLGAAWELSSEETLTAALRDGQATSYLGAVPHESGYGAVIGRTDPDSGLVINVPARRVRQILYDWLPLETMTIRWSYALDPLSAVTILLVTGLGLLTHLHGAWSRRRDAGFARFSAALNLFMAALLVLSLADNSLVMLVGWQVAGLGAYLLVGGRRAFLVGRMGDYGFLLAVLLIFAAFGSLDFGKVFTGVEGVTGSPGGLTLITAAALFIVLGVTARSAQIPLQVWWRGAMAGSTPVTALLLAITVVTAGVYTLYRCAPLFAAAPWFTMAAGVVAGALLAVVPRSLHPLARTADAIDRYVVDMAVNGTAIVVELAGHGLKWFRIRSVRAYALSVSLAVLLILGYLVLA